MLRAGRTRGLSKMLVFIVMTLASLAGYAMAELDELCDHRGLDYSAVCSSGIDAARTTAALGGLFSAVAGPSTWQAMSRGHAEQA
jgi:hypothetical protein